MGQLAAVQCPVQTAVPVAARAVYTLHSTGCGKEIIIKTDNHGQLQRDWRSPVHWIVGAGHGHAGCCNGMSAGRKLARTLHLHSVPVSTWARVHRGTQAGHVSSHLILPGHWILRQMSTSFLSFIFRSDRISSVYIVSKLVS